MLWSPCEGTSGIDGTRVSRARRRLSASPCVRTALCQGSPPENLEEVPRIWEGEGYRRSEILNPINNDYWVGSLKPALVAELHHLPLTRFSVINWVVIINWVQYLGPPVPLSVPDSRDPLEILGGPSWHCSTVSPSGASLPKSMFVPPWPS